jgi:UDP-N-acetylmuramate--alanine ligase
MSGLALVAHQLGATVTGSDLKDGIFVASLRRAGVNTITLGQDPANLPEAGEVVYSSAVRTTNPERAAAAERGLGELHRSQLLAEMTRMHRTIAVCGAHGKTTTTALLAHVLTECGMDPSYVVGGLLAAPAAHARAGDSGWLVIEADESDRSLLAYHADIVLVTNVDLDHTGAGDAGYRNTEEVAKVLAEFAGRANRVFGSAQAATSLRPHLGETVTEVEPEHGPAGGREFVLNGSLFVGSHPGWHNARNAALVVAVARQLGCADEAIREALATFPGLARRFEHKGTLPGGVTVYEDYAHHPAEVAAVIAAGREVTRGRVLVVFQPHLFSRTQQFADQFATALAEADSAWVLPVYAAREHPADWDGVTSRSITELAHAGPTVSSIDDRHEVIRLVRDQVADGDVVLVVGAGDVGAVAEMLVSDTSA